MGETPSIEGTSSASEAESLIASAGARFAAVEAAIAALEAGTYGTCEICGGAIESDRLLEHASERRCATHPDGAAAVTRLF